MPEDIQPDQIEEIQNSDEIWVIDFWAEWCGPCKKFAPIFESVSEEYNDINFGKVDMEEHQEIGQNMGVRALPTTLILKDGEEIARNAGLMQEDEFRNWIEEETA